MDSKPITTDEIRKANMSQIYELVRTNFHDDLIPGDLIESVVLKLLIELKKLRSMRAPLVSAIQALKRGDNCWCEMAIGNPMYREHSEACKQAAAALRQVGGEG